LDIDLIAQSHGLTSSEVIALHTARIYRVYLIGFLPGFAYMGTADKRIATPRKTSPRISVPAGSVGIAGEQTGIYPFDSPGGWQLIGRTPLQLFDTNSTTPCLLQPGDEVQFYPIDISEFNQLSNNGHPRS
jgi:inhibitor of KinA